MNTFEKVKKILVNELGCAPDAVKLEAEIIADLQADSLAIMQIVMGIEDEFQLSIEEDDYAKFITVANIVDYINNK